MNRRWIRPGKLQPRGLLIAALGFMMLVAAAISSANHATQPVLTLAEASNGAAEIVDAVLPKADRDQRLRTQLMPSDGDDASPPVLAALTGHSFPPAAQESLPDPPAGAAAPPNLSTRYSAPRAPPLSA